MSTILQNKNNCKILQTNFVQINFAKFNQGLNIEKRFADN